MRGDPEARGAPGARPPWWSRHGVATLVVAGVLAVASVVLTTSISYPTGIGVMLLVAALYVATLYVLVIGVVELRTDHHDADEAVLEGHTWMCHVTDHRYVRVPERGGLVEHWRCRRCGKRRWTAPRSAGETLNATRVDQMWIKRGDEM